MKTLTLPAFLLSVAALTGGLALSSSARGSLGQEPWLVSRAAGLASFALLSASVVLGLLMSTRIAGKRMSKPFVFSMHQFLAILTLVLVGVHGGALLLDGFLHFTPVSLLVPFTSPYRPLWVGIGVISAWSAAAVTASFWARRRVGYKAWRKLHYLSFGAWGMALLHGLNSGTDSSLPAVQLLYFGSAALIGGLLAYRILNRPAKAAPKGPSTASGASGQSRREGPAVNTATRRNAA